MGQEGPISEADQKLLDLMKRHGPGSCSNLGYELYGFASTGKGRRNTKPQAYARIVGKAMKRLREQGLVRQYRNAEKDKYKWHWWEATGMQQCRFCKNPAPEGLKDFQGNVVCVGCAKDE